MDEAVTVLMAMAEDADAQGVSELTHLALCKTTGLGIRDVRLAIRHLSTSRKLISRLVDTRNRPSYRLEMPRQPKMRPGTDRHIYL